MSHRFVLPSTWNFLLLGMVLHKTGKRKGKKKCFGNKKMFAKWKNTEGIAKTFMLFACRFVSFRRRYFSFCPCLAGKKKTAGDVADAPNVPTALPSFRLLKMARKINSRMKSVFYPPSLPPSLSPPPHPPLLLLLLPNYIQNSVWQPSGRLESKSDSDIAKTPVVAQLSLRPKANDTSHRSAFLFIFWGDSSQKTKPAAPLFSRV